MTMVYEFDLQDHKTISNSGGLTHVLDAGEDGVHADIGLRIIRPLPEAGQLDFSIFGPAVKSTDLNLSGISKRPPEEIFARVEDCRKAWKNVVVDLKTYVADREPKYQFPFQSAWDFEKEPQLLNDAAPSLARAGDSLFKAVFELKGDDGLKEIGQTLRALLSQKPRCIAITSSDLFLPWGMLYTHPIAGDKLASDGSNWKKEGFWGYQHIVQQNPNRIKPNDVICPDSSGSVVLSVNFDDRLSAALQLPVIDSHIAFISALAGKNPIKRTKKSELELGFKEERARLERILYFYCHGHGSSNDNAFNLNMPHLVLSDAAVTASDFEDWAEGHDLSTNPLIFINACQGGQMQTMFYQSFAVELLQEGAAGLIGAQIDVPAVFGAAYGQQVFAKFFAKDKGRVRMGPLLQEINQAMWDVHKNPLGLVYSLYRGVNCFIDWPKRYCG